MKNLYLLITFFFLSSNFLFAQINNQVQLVAREGLQVYLDKIPNGKEALYGFNTREEFQAIQIGIPFPVYILSKDFFSDSVLEANRNYLTKTEEYRVPLIVNGENRTLLTIAPLNGTLKVVGIGAAGLAREFEKFTKGTSNSNPRRLFRVLPLAADFVLLENEFGWEANPLFSGKMALGLDETDMTSYRLFALLSVLKQKLLLLSTQQ